MDTHLGLQCLNCGHHWTVDRSQPDPFRRRFVAEVQSGDLHACPACGGFDLHTWEVGTDAARRS